MSTFKLLGQLEPVVMLLYTVGSQQIHNPVCKRVIQFYQYGITLQAHKQLHGENIKWECKSAAPAADKDFHRYLSGR